LIILIQFEDFGGGVEGSACALGHHNFHISGKAEVCDFEFLILIKENIIWF
jgi:hypothetical protein